MSTSPAPLDAPWAFSWERRHHGRQAVDLPASLHGPRGDVPVRATNLSASGVLLRVMEADLCSVRPVKERSVLFALARASFAAHLEIVFLERGVAATARLVRMVSQPDETDRMYMGCRFLQPLGALPLRRLGMPADLAAEQPTRLVAPTPPDLPAAEVRVQPEGSLVPAGEGLLADVGDHRLTVRLAPAEPGAILDALGLHPASVFVKLGGVRVFASRGHVLAVHHDEVARAVQVTFLTNSDPREALAAGRRPVPPTP
jgi:hypothetical protein